MRAARASVSLLVPVLGLPVCDTHWTESYSSLDDTLSAVLPSDGSSGEREGEGVFSKKEYACAACVKLVVDSKSCDVIPSSKCYAYDVMGHFGTKTVEKVTGGKLGTTTIEDTTDENWTYALSGTSLPDGAVECAPVLYKAMNPDATRQVIDAACASGNALCEDHPNKFQECCGGMVPPDQLCATGKFCCGEEGKITFGKDKKEECAAATNAATNV
ncbi:unnamed protein product [Amoebophrya sp. A25]|nr:unnamed protein product [Amoebophrya sp. A25]CAD7976651.1 unnamed protein product [Amoebophrya sp. A25]|eukprot:GSA25T00027159001.1